MKIFKTENYNFNKKNNNIGFQSKSILTKTKIQPKMDLFCKSPEIKEALMNKFIKLRENFSEKLYPIVLKLNISRWNFYINSTNENLEIMTKDFDELTNLWQDENLYKEFLKLKDIELNKHEQKQLKDILKSFEEELNSGEDLKKLRDKQNEIAKKYNSYIPKINGKETTIVEISEILQKEKDIDLRKKAYEANIIGGDLIAEDLREFAKIRNEYAKKQGFSNYFEYKLKDSYEVDINELEMLLDDVYNKTLPLIKEYIKKEQEDLKKVFNTEKLEPYFYGFLSSDNSEKKINDSLKSKEQIVDIAKKIYSGMGYNLDELQKNGNLTLDLFPRKNKNTHGFCFGIDTGSDARILANLTNNARSLETLTHELGHCIYTLGNSKDLPYFDRDEYPAMTEAIAMMMQDLQKRENVLNDIVDSKTLEEYRKDFIKDEILFITRALTIINFEKEMYKNPDQDLKQLWHDMKVKYQMRDEKEDLDNGWATIPHYLSHPAYYQNYFRATIIKAQMYNYLKEKLGNITENSKTAEVLKEKLFKLGTSMEENELIENFTGKKLSVDDFFKSLK